MCLIIQVSGKDRCLHWATNILLRLTLIWKSNLQSNLVWCLTDVTLTACYIIIYTDTGQKISTLQVARVLHFSCFIQISKLFGLVFIFFLPIFFTLRTRPASYLSCTYFQLFSHWSVWGSVCALRFIIPKCETFQTY